MGYPFRTPYFIQFDYTTTNISQPAKKEVKKGNVRTKVYKEVYEKLDIKEVEKDIYIYNYSNKREKD